MNEILTFTLIALLLVISPGPNSVLILKTATAHGKAPSLLNILGLTSATFFHGMFSIFGISALLLQSAELFFIIKILGAGYLLYIGVKAIIQSFRKAKPEISDTDTKVVREKGERSRLSFFFEGFLTQILNPKVSMFYLAAFPQFTDPATFSFVDSFLLVAIHAAIIFAWFVAMTYAIEKIKTSSKQSAFGLWMQRLSGSVMIYFSSLILSQK
ncbi:LysE family translocator [Endozoicomonadaceae bacterium StTr2]